MNRRIAARLSAASPGWTSRADVIVVGSGVAGLKAQVDEGSTKWAQGGIAAALADDDSPENHLADTLVAGVGLCDEEAVRILVTQGPHVLRHLIELGARFDTDGVPATPGIGDPARHRRHHRYRVQRQARRDHRRPLRASC